MLIGTMGMFLVTAVSGNAAGRFSDYRMFRHINGRLVLARQNGAVIGEEELQSLAAELGAQGVLHCDALLDEGGYYIFLDDGSAYTTLQYTYGEDFGSDVIGRYPEARDEVLLYLPIAYQPKYGKDSLAVQEIELEGMAFRVVGVKYYYDTNQSGQVLLTEEGFRLITAAHYLLRNVNLQVSVDFNQPDYPGYSFSSNTGYAAEDVEPGKIYISDPDYRQRYKQYLADAAADPDLQMTITVRLDTTYYNYNYDFTDSSSTRTYSRIFGNGDLTDTEPSSLSAGGALVDNPFSAGGVVFSPELLLERSLTRESVRRGLRSLPEDYREILLLREIQGLSYDEIAAALNIEVGTVKSRIFRGRKKLCDYLIKDGNIPEFASSGKTRGGELP